VTETPPVERALRRLRALRPGQRIDFQELVALGAERKAQQLEREGDAGERRRALIEQFLDLGAEEDDEERQIGRGSFIAEFAGLARSATAASFVRAANVASGPGSPSPSPTCRRTNPRGASWRQGTSGGGGTSSPCASRLSFIQSMSSGQTSRSASLRSWTIR
jgi:hypothetical protein